MNLSGVRRRPDPRDLTSAMYAALGEGDVPAMRRLLAPDFRARLTPGLPWELGRLRVESADTMIRQVWGKVAEELRIAPVPEETHVIDDAVVVVQGAYRGSARRTGRTLDAWFVHIWLVDDGRFVALKQVTDTAAWRDAVEDLPS